MYLVNFNTETGRVLSAGLIAAEVLPRVLPEGTVAVDQFPEGRATDYRYTGGKFIKITEAKGATE